MELLRSPCSQSNDRPESEAFQFPILHKLPLEIIMCIMEFLPSESTIALSLTCKHYLRCFFEKCLAKMLSSTDKVALLELLAIDLRDQIACSACVRLQKFENVRRYRDSTYDSDVSLNLQRLAIAQEPACVNRDIQNQVSEISGNFSSTAFKMVMKMYRQQAPTSISDLPKIYRLDSDHYSLLQSMSREANTTKMHSGISIDAEDFIIHQGRLMHRLQVVYLYRKKPDLIRLTYFCVPYSHICHHVYLQRGLRTREMESKVTQRNQCQSCRTEYSVSFMNSEMYGPCAVVNRWKDLGPGPEDGIWEAHCPILGRTQEAVRSLESRRRFQKS
ncbi:uncharacterized protein RCO7_15123 [Rhynchosporium graminicola]|uniref:F-box domain-containing protein n=1 Tax=Rhynchosporium graminicola TaxID=2792576 RepID=A0A1E1LL45_9HELO|nr:uncharacterized protein RCO7_15123 [Rhynchosporium commune]